MKHYFLFFFGVAIISSCDLPADNTVTFEKKETYKWMFSDSIVDSINQAIGSYSNENLLYRTFQYKNDFSKFDPGYVIDILEIKNNASVFNREFTFDYKSNNFMDFEGGNQVFDPKSDAEVRVSNTLKNLKSLKVMGEVKNDSILRSDYFIGIYGSSQIVNVLDQNSKLKIQLVNRTKSSRAGIFFSKKGTSLYIIKFSSDKPFDEKLFKLVDWSKFDRVN
nr:hypothetical protein [uncultured Flavobacterium sp.]